MTDQRNVTPEDRYRAQDLAYEAMQAADGAQVQQMCAEALELDPRCTDAMLIVSRMPMGHDQRIEILEQIVEVALEDLGGAAFIEENRGLCWGLLETRPYMRARAHLAIEYEDAGRLDAAIAEYEEMLDLNPDDHQGMRHMLLSAYLGLDDFAGVRTVLQTSGVDAEAVFAWAYVLERFEGGDEVGAGQALATARNLNPFFEAYANGSQRLPPEQSGMYVRGEESEAAFICSIIGEAWLDQPGFVDWMVEQQVSRPFIAGKMVGRNDPCPCGSGKKYKRCCLGKSGAPTGHRPV